MAAHLAALARDPPAWPPRTEDLSTLELVLEVKRQTDPAGLVSGLLGSRTVTLELLDYPGDIPLKPPGPDYWQQGFFQMPDFQPPRLDPQGGHGVPHLDLDTVLASLIGDVL